MSVSRRAQLDSSSPCKGEDRWGSKASRFSRTPERTSAARRLRRDSTMAERKLWYFLQRNQMEGVSFRRQHSLGSYFVDFYCASLRLAIEVDGGQHGTGRVAARDKRRTLWLRARGVTVLRFWNNEVLQNTEGVWEEIARSVASLKQQPTTPTLTLPLSGGGQAAEIDR